MPEATDGEIVARTRAGDRDAYSALVGRYQGHVYGLAYSLTGNWADAQDIAQETFIRAYVNLHQLRDPARFAPWLRRVAFGVAMNWLKAFRPGFFQQIEGQVDLDTLDIPDFAPGPAELAEKRELADAVQRALASLPQKYRVPLTMFHLDGLSYRKVAEFLDIPLGTAQSLIHRARQKLRVALAAYAAEEVIPMVQEVFNEHKLPEEFARKVLDNVPALGWGRQRDCTFLGALEAALAVTDHPAKYSDLMGWSGMAFRVRWFTGNDKVRWCPSCAVGEMDEEIQAVERATGWPLRVSFLKKDDAAAMEQLTADFVASINLGRPALAYEPRLNMAVVFGYQDGGKVLLLRDYSQPDRPLELAPSELGFLVLFLGEHAEGMPPRDALLASLRIAVRNWRRERFAEGPGPYWYGEAALNRWRADIAEADAFSDEDKAHLCFVSRWNYTTMHDARLAAVTFLRQNADLLPAGARPALEQAAQLYQQEAEFLGSALANRDAFTTSLQDWSRQMRQREQEILSQAREIEASAISIIETALP